MKYTIQVLQDDSFLLNHYLSFYQSNKTIIQKRHAQKGGKQVNMKWIGTTSNDNYIIEVAPDEWEEMAYSTHRVDGIDAALVTYRKTNSVTQQSMAHRIGISRTYYSLIERGKASNYSHTIYRKILAAISYN